MILRLARFVVHVSAWLAPRDRRAQWREEWLAEIETAESGIRHATILRRALGAPRDALACRWIAHTPIDLRSGFGADLRDALRALSRSPLQTGTMIVCLVLGSTATVLMFALINAGLGGELPGVRDRNRLVRLGVEEVDPERSGPRPLTMSEFHAVPAELPGLGAVGAEYRWKRFSAYASGRATSADVWYVNGSYFGVLGTQPVLGRLIQAGDVRPDAPPVAVLGHTFWQQHFGGQAHALGSTLSIGTETFVVIGVAPPGFTGLRRGNMEETADAISNVWLPMSSARGGSVATAFANGESVGPAVIARLADGIDRSSAEAGLQFLTARLRDVSDDTRSVTGVRLRPFHFFDLDTDPWAIAGGAIALMLVPFIVLAIGCANVAGVQLSRAAGRTHELAVRAALGASRARVVRLLVLETAVVALVASVAAWAVSTQVLRLSGRVLPFVVTADVRVFAFSLILPAVITLMAGLFPARRASGFNVLAGLRLGARAGRVASPVLRRVVVGVQITLSVALLTTAAYLVRGLETLPATFGRFQDDVLVVDVSQMDLGFSPERQRMIRASILDRIRALPAVSVAADVDDGLFSPANGPRAKPVTPDWFQAVGLRMLEGRVFTERDPDVAVINETWANRLGGRDKALRAHVNVGGVGDVPVVGIVENGYERVAWTREVPVAYVPLRSTPDGAFFTLYLRAPSVSTLAPVVQDILSAEDPRIATREIGTIADRMHRRFRPIVQIADALWWMGAAALILVGVGLFGALAQVAGQRRHEFGVRIALGARPAEAVMAVVRESLVISLAGTIVGVAMAGALANVFRVSYLAAMSPFDPVPALVASAAVVGIALVATFVPARRMTTIDPSELLRRD